MTANTSPALLSRQRIACLSITLLIGASSSCDKPPPVRPPAAKDEASADIPVLTVKEGDTWRYSVQIEIPAGVTGPDSEEIQLKSELVRRYIGKVKPALDLPEVDCFEVTSPNTSTEREFVEISDRVILMRGSITLRPDVTAPSWLEPGVPFVFAGMKAGEALRELQAGSEKYTRNLRVVAREEVTVPAGTYSTVRLLMTGFDDAIELRRTIWFAFGTGIVREEKLRYGGEKLLVRETHELAETSVGR